MKGIFRGIFISLALLAGAGCGGGAPRLSLSIRCVRNWSAGICRSGSYSCHWRLRIKGGRRAGRNMVAHGAGRYQGEALCRKTATESDKGTGDVAEVLMTNDREVVRTEQDRGVASNLIGRSTCDLDSTDVRFDDYLSTVIALDRLQELFNEYGDWNMSIVAYATSPTALAAMDSTAFANAPILRSLRNAEEEYSENIPAAFERIGSLAAKRKAERLAFLQEQAALRKARLDSLRKRQAANTDRITYTIRRGDTLGGIAARYRVKVSDLKRWNNLRSDMIREGRKLVIYR